MPMKIGSDSFKERVEKGLNNDFMRGAVAGAQERLRTRRIESFEELGNLEDWRALGEEIRKHTIQHLDYYLMQLSENVAKRGGHVFFAVTAEEATDYIKEVVIKKEAKKIVKSKSMVSEEINMNAIIEELGCEVVETDLGEYILQIDDHDPPSHIVAPALHKNKEQIRDVFHEKLGYQNSEKPEEMTAFARMMLRKEFLSADIGITGCNFAIAESGTISLVTNEGNARMTTTLPKTQITVMGLERIVPTFEEFEVLVSLLTRSAVGQKLTSYVTALTGPKDEGDVDGPEEFHLVIIDNGRSKILGTEFQPILSCIRCAACVNVCPTYRHVGGHSYGTIYSGPVGAVLAPLLGGYDAFKELPDLCTLCGACTEVCPVNIPLHTLIHAHRVVKVEKEGLAPTSEKLAMKAFGLGAASPTMYNIGSKIAPSAMSPFVEDEKISKGPGMLRGWTDSRDLPAPSKNRFRDWMKNKDKEG